MRESGAGLIQFPGQEAWACSLTKTVAEVIPAWAGKMSYEDKKVRIDAKLFWLTMPLALTTLIGILAWSSMTIISQGMQINGNKIVVEAIQQEMLKITAESDAALGALRQQIIADHASLRQEIRDLRREARGRH